MVRQAAGDGKTAVAEVERPATAAGQVSLALQPDVPTTPGEQHQDVSAARTDVTSAEVTAPPQDLSATTLPQDVPATSAVQATKAVAEGQPAPDLANDERQAAFMRRFAGRLRAAAGDELPSSTCKYKASLST